MKSLLRAKKDTNFKELHGKQKLQYIWDYYKFPIAVVCILLYILVYTLYGHFTKKEIILYSSLVNVNASEELTTKISTDFLDTLDLNHAKQDMQLATGLYLTDDEANAYYEYTYASQMKILASIESEQLDVVLMNKEAFDAFSQSGYLCDLEELFSSSLADVYDSVEPLLVDNIIILEDNAMEVTLDASVAYESVIEEKKVGLDLSKIGIIAEAGFDDTVYLGIIENSPRKDMAVTYVKYLLSE